MDQTEVMQLRTFAEHRALKDLAAGRTQGPLAWAVVDGALSTGLRVSELAALTCGDVDLRRGALSVPRHKRKKATTESLAIAPEFVEHLRDYLAWKTQVGRPAGKDDALFHGKRGPLSIQGLQQIWKAAIRQAGLPKELSIHSARHTVAVHLLRKTRNLRQVQKQLGHASPATTANMYADVSFEDMREGVTGLYGQDAAEG
jgi:integrase